ncbi:MAG: Plasmid stabilization system protein [Bacteroidetes bacterium]|nr:Plasmid stabilization system protein [Bacteroidota bacterium]
MLVEWTAKAITHLEKLYENCIYYTKSERIASKLYNKLLDASAILETFPESGKLEPSLSGLSAKDFRAIVVEHKYKLIYFVADDKVLIVTVWDCRRNPESLKV